MTEPSKMWVVVYRESIFSLSTWKRWLIRFSYRKTDWASDYNCQECGVYDDEADAKIAAAAACKEFGGYWRAIPVPRNALMEPRPMVMGPSARFGTDVAADYEAHDLRPNVLVAKTLAEWRADQVSIDSMATQIDQMFARTKSA